MSNEHTNGNGNGNPEDVQEVMNALAKEAQAFFTRIIHTDTYEIGEGFPELGPWTPYAIQIVEAYREAYYEHKEDKEAGQKAASWKYRELIRTDAGLMKLMSARIKTGYMIGQTKPEPVAPLVPPLPANAQLDYSQGMPARAWLDEFCAWVQRWADISYPGHIEGMGLWVLSTVAARRLMLKHISPTYTPLLIALVGDSSVYAKTTAMKLTRQLLDRAGLSYLLLGTDPTPQAFWRRLSGIIPENYGAMSPQDQELVRLELAFSAQRGWRFDEFGTRLSSMLNDRSPYAEFHRILRVIDDCDPEYIPETITRGSEKIKLPYLALLAGITPGDLQKYARRGAEIWRDGTLGRFGLIFPPQEQELPEANPPLPEYEIVPAALVEPLAAWHQRLGIPDVDVIIATEKDKTGYTFTRTVLHEHRMRFGKDTREAQLRYFNAMRKLIKEGQNSDFNSNLSRLPEQALRISMLFASLQGFDTIELQHWIAAQEIAERWRASLYKMYEYINKPEPSKNMELEERIKRQFLTNGPWMSARDIAGRCGLDSPTAKDWCEKLYYAGALIREENQHAGSYSYALQGTPPKERKARARSKE